MEEQELIEHLRLGDQKSYALLIDMHKDMVYSVCLSFVPNTQDAEDLSQEVFVEVFQAIHKFRGESKLSTWLYRIATNKALMFLRKQKTKKRFAFLESLFFDNGTIRSDLNHIEINHPGIQLEHKEAITRFYQIINKLPKAQQEVFILAKIEGLSYLEIVEVTKKTKGAVESLLFRAKRNLEKELKKYPSFDLYKK